MNLSEVVSCRILGKKYSFTEKTASEKLYINRIFLTTFNAAIIIPTILLNAIAIATIAKSRKLSKKTCYFIILIQSMIDLAVGVFGIPSNTFVLASRIGGVSNCSAVILVQRFKMILTGVSIITLTALTLDRYIAILHPFVYKTLVTKKKMLVFVSFAFLIKLTFILLSLVLTRTIMVKSIATSRVIILLLTTLAYLRIYLVAKTIGRSPNLRQQPAAREEGRTRMKLFLQQVKLAKSCFFVVLCYFVLCCLPIVVVGYFLETIYSGGNDVFLVGTLWTVTLALLNSSVNSLIFFWTNTMLRKEAVKMLKRLRPTTS